MEDAPALEDPYLRNWLADLRSTSSEARALFEELSAEQLTWKPAPKKWSVAECFRHLVVAAELYHPRIAATLEHVHKEGRIDKKPFKARWLQRKFIAMVGPQSRRKVKTTRHFAPEVAELDAEQVKNDFFDRQEELGELIRRADGLDLNEGRVVSPAFRLLAFSPGEVFWMLTAHAQRHLLQAQRLRRSPEFPA